MNPNFDFESAKKAGYTDDEIKTFLANQPKNIKPKYETFNKNDSPFTRIKKNFGNFFGNLENPVEKTIQPENEESQINPQLLKKVPNFDIQGAIQAGYSPDEINEFLEENQPQKGALESGIRTAEQFGLGLLQGSPPGLAYDLSVAPIESKGAMAGLYRQNVLDDLEQLEVKKQSGQWTKEDQELYNHLKDQIENPEKADQYVQTADVSILGLAEKATGQDLHPETILEKGANWVGMIKDPKNVKKLGSWGTTSKEVIKNIIPSVKDGIRGLSAGTALQMAEQNQFGPLGTLAAVIVGDLGGAAIPGITKAITQPKKTLFSGLNRLANTKTAIKNDLKQASEGKEFIKDIGTITDNNIVKMIQSRLAASGLVGEPLQDLRKQMTQEIVGEYEAIARELGEATTLSSHELGELAKSGIKELRDQDLKIARNLYKQSEHALRENAGVDSSRLASSIEELENNLKPGSIKSTEQQAVLNYAEKLKNDIYSDVEKKILKPANVKSLINNKIALNDIINYEVQGGTKQLLKNIVGELDRAIISHGKENPSFAKNYINANKKFSEHAKTFRNKNVDQLLKTVDPSKIMNKMDSLQGIRDIRKILSRSSGGKELFNNMARKKLDNLLGNNMKDGITEQLKSGKFFNIIEKPKNRELIKELLSPHAYKRLINLQKHVGKLAESAQKFFNSSQSATAAADLAAIGTILSGVFGLLTGNPFALSGALAIGIGAKELSKLLGDAKFLNLIEKCIKSSEKNNIKLMNLASEEMATYIRETSGPAIRTGTEN